MTLVLSLVVQDNMSSGHLASILQSIPHLSFNLTCLACNDAVQHKITSANSTTLLVDWSGKVSHIELSLSCKLGTPVLEQIWLK